MVMVWAMQLWLTIPLSLTHLQCLVQKYFELVACGSLDRADLMDSSCMDLLQALANVAVYCDSKTLVGVVCRGCGL